MNILNQCGNNQARVTSACSQFLSGVPTSTSTILSTTTPTLYTTASATITGTSTVNVVATTTSTVQPPAPTNLVVNGNFDETDDIERDWTVFGDACGPACGTGVIQHDTFVSAPAALKVSITQQSSIFGGYYSLGQDFYIDNSKEYIFSFSYRAEQAGTTLRIVVECGEYAPDALDTSMHPTTEWQTFTSGRVSFANTGSSSAMMYINFDAYPGIGVTDTVYLDDVKVVPA